MKTYCKGCRQEVNMLVGHANKAKGVMYTVWYCSNCKKQIAIRPQENI